jgi:hypothetical protein
LTLDLTIEAISLPTADSKTTLPKKKEGASGLALAKLSEYRDPIAKRDIFAPWVRPDQRVELPPMVDAAKYTYITGFTEVDGASKVWLWDRMKDKKWQLATGESFSVENVKGTVQSISPEGEAVVDFAGRHLLLHDGDNLFGATKIPDQQPTKIQDQRPTKIPDQQPTKTEASEDSDQSDPDAEN